MVRMILATLVLSFFTFGLIAADNAEKKAPTLKGTWVKKGDGFTMKFIFKDKKTMVVDVQAGDNTMILNCDYTVDKAGMVKAAVTKVKSSGEIHVPDNYKFSFTIKVEGKNATISNFDASNKDEAAAIVEGEYQTEDK